MKLLPIFTALLLTISFVPVKSQDALPKGFAMGSVILADNSEVTGYIKDDIKNKASVVLIPAAGGKKIIYDGDKLNGATVGGTKYICIKGDFFKLVCEGEISFLQKASDASSKPVYAGNEPMFINGTNGKPGDYFIYNNKQKELHLINEKNLAEVTAKQFAGCGPALAKAKESEKDITLLKEAVIIYNNRDAR